jgi:hypothetical protein
VGVAASLSWYGQRYHWTRRLAGDTVALDCAFRAGVFDFADRLVTNLDGTWATDETVANGRVAHVYEIHARHYDTLPLPYLHAYWGILTEEDGMHGIEVQAIRRYSAAAL